MWNKTEREGTLVGAGAMRLTARGVLVFLLGCLPSAATAAPITLSQIDTFQDLTTGGWFAGGGPLGQIPPVPPQVVTTGGPTGANDAWTSDEPRGHDRGRIPGGRIRVDARRVLHLRRGPDGAAGQCKPAHLEHDAAAHHSQH